MAGLRAKKRAHGRAGAEPLHDVYNQTAEQATNVPRDTDYQLKALGRVLQSAVYQVPTDQAIALLQKMRHEAPVKLPSFLGRLLAGNGLATRTIRVATYSAEQISEVLQKVCARTDTQAIDLLKDIHYTCEAIGQALRSVYGTTDKQVAKLLKNAAYLTDQVSRTIRAAFSASSASAVASAMQNAGFGLKDTGNFIKDSFGITNPNDLKKALQDANYAVNSGFINFFRDLKGTFKDLGNALANGITGTLHKYREVQSQP